MFDDRRFLYDDDVRRSPLTILRTPLAGSAAHLLARADQYAPTHAMTLRINLPIQCQA